MGFRPTRAAVPGFPVAVLLCALTCLVLFTDPTLGAPRPEIAAPVATGGVLDLRNWSFERDGNVSLAGDWQFWWQQLPEPDQAVPGDVGLQQVPGIWTDYPEAYPASGYATFRLKVLLPPGQKSLAIANEGQSSAFSLWVDGQHHGNVGRVGPTREEMVATKQRATYFLDSVGAELAIQVQISNFHHRKAGFRNALVLGRAVDIHTIHYRGWITDAFVLGIICSIGFYFLFMYFSHREDHAPLNFALLCLLVALRASLTNRNLLGSMFPDTAWEALLKLEYLTFFWALFFYIGFMRALYPAEYGLALLRSNALVAAGFSALLLFSDTMTASWLIPPYQAVHFVFLVALFACLGRVVVRQRPYYLYIASASVIVGTFNLLEILNLEGVLPERNLNHIGFLAFIFVQAVLLSKRSADTYRQITRLSGELEGRNLELQESEQKYRSLFEDSSDTIFVTSNGGKILDTNPACRQLLGYEPEELRNINNFELLSDKEDRERLAEEINRYGGVVDFQSFLVHRDGHRVPVLVSASPRLDENGEQIGYQGYVRNLSDRMEAHRQRQRAEELEVIATVDPLTRVFNRRYFEQAAQAEQSLARRSGSPLSLILMDIDYFKHINDKHGHLAGDQVLATVAAAVHKEVRKSDIFARYGGEEFVLLLPGTTLEQAMKRAEQLRKDIEALDITSTSGASISISVSLGVAGWPEHQELKDTLAQADEALYRAKASGRNCTQAWVA